MNAPDRTTEILGDLVAFPFLPDESNRPLIDYAANLLDDCGAQIDIIEDPSGTRANLFATVGPQRDGGIILSGHTDVVPADETQWTSHPFRLRKSDGRLYGRGSCDMKGFLACCLATAPLFARTTLGIPVHFAFTYDEEVGCHGARRLVDHLKRSEVKPAMAIIGEPTSMRIIEGHKGCFEYTTSFFGLEGHACEPEAGVNAIEYAVRYVSELQALADALKARAPEGSRFSPPWTSLQIGRINGGLARNMIAGQCDVEWEMRPVSKTDAQYVKQRLHTICTEELLPAMRTVSPDTSIITHVVGEVDGLEPVQENKTRDLVARLTGENSTDVVSFGTEAGLFQSMGLSAVVCGPGSIDQAHKPDEFIELTQLTSCLKMLERLSAKLSDGVGGEAE